MKTALYTDSLTPSSLRNNSLFSHRSLGPPMFAVNNCFLVNFCCYKNAKLTNQIKSKFSHEFLKRPGFYPLMLLTVTNCKGHFETERHRATNTKKRDHPDVKCKSMLTDKGLSLQPKQTDFNPSLQNFIFAI